MKSCCINEAVSMDRILEKYDELLNLNYLDQAEKHLLYWEKEFKESFDKRNLLTLENELIGLYRQSGKKEEAYKAIDLSMQLLKELNLIDTMTMATTYINIATAYKVFEDFENSLQFYQGAEEIWISQGYSKNNYKYASLCNNYALVLMDVEKYDIAKEYFYKAMESLDTLDNTKLEVAMTYLNLANLEELQDNTNEIKPLLEKAKLIFDDHSIERDGFYAYVCSKSEGVFGYYNDENYALELQRRREEIYERLRTSK